MFLGGRGGEGQEGDLGGRVVEGVDFGGGVEGAVGGGWKGQEGLGWTRTTTGDGEVIGNCDRR